MVNIKKILTKEFIAYAIISYKIENCSIKKKEYNKYLYTANCKFCPVKNKCRIANKTYDNLYIFDRQTISCSQYILHYFNIKNNYQDYIKKIKICDIIELIKSYRMNYYEDASCKYIDKSLLNCPLFDICKKHDFKYNCCYSNENDNLLIWNVEDIKKE